MISICSQQCNYSMKRQRFCCFMSFAQNADIHMSGKQRNSPIDTKWEDNYLYNGQPSTSCRTSIVIFFKQQFGFYIGTEGSVQFFWRIGNVIRCSRDSKCQARSGKPWTSTQKKDEMHTWAPTQGILVWWQPITVHLVDLEAFVPAHYSERVNSDSEGDASKEETHKRKHSVHAYCRKKPKEICSAIRKDGDLTAAEQKIFSEGRESRNNHRYAVVVHVLATQWNPCQTQNFTGDGEEFTRVYSNRRRSQKVFIRTFCWNLESIVKNYRGIIGQLHFINQTEAELQSELCVEQKKRHQPYYCNLYRMISGG